MRNINAARTSRGQASSERQALTEEVLEQMSIMRAEVERARVGMLLQRSVSLTHLHVLAILKSLGPIPMGELAGALDVSVASCTGIVSRMEDRGLVERDRSPEDRRIVTVRIAPGGQTALEELHGRGREKTRDLLGRLSLEELQLVRGAFEALGRARESRTEERPKVANT